MEVAVRELKNHLSIYLRRAEAGEEIVVTSHGRSIVRTAGVLNETPEVVEADAVVRLREQPWVRSGSDVVDSRFVAFDKRLSDAAVDQGLALIPDA